MNSQLSLISATLIFLTFLSIYVNSSFLGFTSIFTWYIYIARTIYVYMSADFDIIIYIGEGLHGSYGTKITHCVASTLLFFAYVCLKYFGVYVQPFYYGIYVLMLIQSLIFIFELAFVIMDK